MISSAAGNLVNVTRCQCIGWHVGLVLTAQAACRAEDGSALVGLIPFLLVQTTVAEALWFSARLRQPPRRVQQDTKGLHFRGEKGLVWISIGFGSMLAFMHAMHAFLAPDAYKPSRASSHFSRHGIEGFMEFARLTRHCLMLLLRSA